ncbi:hypothetical protein H6F67_00260 [Microcoleus sp. FACHB-1515]|uniref:hypothetical protein n=1 Tax=Cyanophyceae TaxID=3028117 RepID=UPI0016887E0F|nr:hypothetical protein [Microcoleus sp. FACHB-1515]MBD2088308.1 hypothetical protein [Microcoleus sp. FACHB-1515]
MTLKSEWDQIPREKRPKSFSMGLPSHSRTPVESETYLRCREQVSKPDYWEVLTDMALEA